MSDNERETGKAVFRPSSVGEPPRNASEPETVGQPSGCLTAGIAFVVAVLVVLLASTVCVVAFTLLASLLPKQWLSYESAFGIATLFIGINFGVPAGVAVGYLFPGNFGKSTPTYRAWYLGTLLLLTVLLVGGLTVCGAMIVINKSGLGLLPFVATLLFVLPAMIRARVFRKGGGTDADTSSGKER